MYRTFCWWAVLLALGLVLPGGAAQAQSMREALPFAAGELDPQTGRFHLGQLAELFPSSLTVRGQDYAPPDTVLPVPLGSTRPEDGGFFSALSFTLYRMTNPIEDQVVAIRGFMDIDGGISGTPRTFFGSGRDALNVDQVTGPNRYTPGFKVELGWKFGDGSAVTFGWMYFFQLRRTGSASLLPPDLNIGADGSDSFLFAPVYNFPAQYAGPGVAVDDVPGTGISAYGIWNAADLMTLDFEQKFQQWDIKFRQTVLQDECYRFNASMGPRFSWIWERFRWFTYDADQDGVFGPDSTGIYSNIISNRMYGAFLAAEGEYYLGHGFALSLEAEASAYLNIVKMRAKYELGAKLPPANKRALTDFTVVPAMAGRASLMWYPAEAISFKLGYNVMAFFNTVSMREAVSFDYSGLTPKYGQNKIRFFDGIEASMAIHF